MALVRKDDGTMWDVPEGVLCEQCGDAVVTTIIVSLERNDVDRLCSACAIMMFVAIASEMVPTTESIPA